MARFPVSATKSSSIISKCEGQLSGLCLLPRGLCRAPPLPMCRAGSGTPSTSLSCRCHRALPVPGRPAYRGKLFTGLYVTCKTNYF